MILIVLDLNGVLCHSVTSRASPRPYLLSVFQCMQKLHDEGKARFAIWTSKMQHNALPIIERLLETAGMQSLMPKLLFCWYAPECTIMHDYTRTKNLERIWNLFPEYTAQNTYLVDDTPSKIGKYLNNLVSIPTYDGPQKMPYDCALLNLCDELEKLVQ